LKHKPVISIVCLLTVTALAYLTANSAMVLARGKLTKRYVISRASQKRQARYPAVKNSTDRCNEMSEGIKKDLSGTYQGTVKYPERNLSGDATLEINGDKFTLTSGGVKQFEGRLLARTTCKYTGVTMMIGDFSQPIDYRHPPPPFPALFLQACAKGGDFRLTSKDDYSPGVPRFMFQYPSGKEELGGKEEWGRCLSSYQRVGH
jgi:hypothetical protein